MTRFKIMLSYWAILSLHAPILLAGRNIYRAPDANLPKIEIWQSDRPNQIYTLSDSHIRNFPLFEAYNEPYLLNRQLTTSTVTYRNHPEKSIATVELLNQAEEVVAQLLAGHASFKNFAILKKRDFNFKNHCGLIVLKFKHAPFVLKIFIESAQGFTKPYSKSFFQTSMFITGGTNRHLNGFTRLKNADNIAAKLKDYPAWKDKIELPRKWFWLPNHPQWLQITGYNIGNKAVQHKRIPAIFGIIADEIVAHPTKRVYRQDCLKICKDLDFISDPHYNNFRIEAETNKLLLYDTEHFPTLMGKYGSRLNATQKSLGWYIGLAHKYIDEQFGANKTYRQKRQRPGSIYSLY